MINLNDVITAQKLWAEAILSRDPEAVTDLYATTGDSWEQSTVKGTTVNCSLAFNPTLEDKILTTKEKTLSYFKGTDEKPGFAMKGWVKVIFDPKEHPKAERFITKTSDIAVATGRCVLEYELVVLDSEGNDSLDVFRRVVDYTFVYKKINQDLKIIAHHSSLPISQQLGK